MKRIPTHFERGCVEYYLLAHDIVLEAVEQGAQEVQYCHGQREVRLVGTQVMGRALWQLNRAIAKGIADRARQREQVKGRRLAEPVKAAVLHGSALG
jgi:hypothetical protein